MCLLVLEWILYYVGCKGEGGGQGKSIYLLLSIVTQLFKSVQGEEEVSENHQICAYVLYDGP